MPRRRRGGAARGEDRCRSEHVAGVTLVIVDGRNVQFALRRASTGDLPDAALIARLRAALTGFETRLVLDGHPAGGPQGRIAPGFTVDYGRIRDADTVIGDLVADAARELGPAGVDAVMVVTDDRMVRDQARRHGGRVAGTSWLVERVERAVSGPGGGDGTARPGASIGRARPPRVPRSPRPRRPPGSPRSPRDR